MTADNTGVRFGVVYDLPEDDYHGHPALSCSGAKKLLPPSCPARFKWERDHGQRPKDAFDIGSAAHQIVLGVGRELVEVDAKDWKTKAAQTVREEARARGAVALLTEQLTAVRSMAASIAAHPIASALLNRPGMPEASLFWHDDESGTPLRARLDYLPDPVASRLFVTDLKTAASANPDKFAKAAADYGYHMQAAHYLDGIRALGIHDDPAFLFIVVEKEPPYVVSVIELDEYALSTGRQKMRDAIDVYTACAAEDVWPGYSEDVELVSLPRWAA